MTLNWFENQSAIGGQDVDSIVEVEIDETANSRRKYLRGHEDGLGLW